ncbi:hypothetical protein NC653_026376 [Populus alba x Populus x berolinensis]|uniref:GDSL esterase/lipase n=1 Tax=Populus alba x Populus x berolinensis TaxID=444605 RepID=A0AAD6MFW3_9ROSI|nr:hypothetical protein NC653_026376 [Populus alba x Populus x berolinensis]
MEKQVHFIHFLVALFCFSYIMFSEGLVSGHHENGSVKLFVFGDSYADTGNWDKFAASGKSLMDSLFLVNQLVDSLMSFISWYNIPVPYTWRKTVEKSGLQFGMNFAFGGT